MKTVSVRLQDADFDELTEILEDMGQTKQTIFETFAKTLIRERKIPFIIEASPKQGQPTPRDEMSDAEFNAFLAKGMADSIAGRTTPMNEAFDRLLKEFP